MFAFSNEENEYQHHTTLIWPNHYVRDGLYFGPFSTGSKRRSARISRKSLASKPFYFNHRFISRSTSLSLRVSLLSYCFLPLPNPISILARLFSLKKIRSGMMEKPFSLVLFSSFRNSFFVSNNLRSWT